MKKWIIGNLLILFASGSFLAGPAQAGFQSPQSRQFRPILSSAQQTTNQTAGGINRGQHHSGNYNNPQNRQAQYNRAGGATYQGGARKGQTVPSIRRTAYQDGLQLQAPNSLTHGRQQSSNSLAPRKRNPGGLHYQDSNSLAASKIVKGSSQIIEVDFDFKTILIEDPKIISGFPMSSRKVLVRGLQPGVSAITLSSGDRNTQRSFNISVENDVRQLQAIIDQSFPTANVKVSPLKSSVILRGSVPTPEMVTQILEVARRFSPEVIQNLKIAGAQNVALQMKVYEVSRTKLREFGIDWAVQGGNFFAIQSVAQLIEGATNVTNAFAPAAGDLRAGIINGDTQFFANLRLLEQHDVAKLVDEPFLVTLNGRPANFLGGGEIPIVVNAGLGVASIEFRPFGTKVDMLPFVLGDGRIKLDLQYEISQVAEGLSGATDTPGFLVRRSNGAVVMRAGHSLVIAGHSQKRRTNTKRGLPGLMHLNWGGSLFRDNQELDSETELLIVATPHFVGDVDPAQLPVHGPGQTVMAPSNSEYYIRGYHEVPNVNLQRSGSSYGNNGCQTDGFNTVPQGTIQRQNPHPGQIQGQPIQRIQNPGAGGQQVPNGIPQNTAPVPPLIHNKSNQPGTNQIPPTANYNRWQGNSTRQTQPSSTIPAGASRTPYSQQTRPNQTSSYVPASQTKTQPATQSNNSIFRPLKFLRQ